MLKDAPKWSDLGVMLSINENVILHSNHREHAWALRTIGQDLAGLQPDYLEVEFAGHIYTARGRAQNNVTTAKRNRDGKTFGSLRSPGGRRPGERRESSWFERRYTLYELNRLDDEGLIQRKNRPIAPDIYVLGERLRTIGKIIEAQDGQLLKLTLDNHRVAFTFRDAMGALHQEEHSTPALYRRQQDGNRSRGTGTTRDPWAIPRRRAAARGGGTIKSKLRLMPEGGPKETTRLEKENKR